MVEPITEFPIRRYREGRMAAAPDKVAVEEPLKIRWRGEPFRVLMRLPGFARNRRLNIYTHPHRRLDLAG